MKNCAEVFVEIIAIQEKIPKEFSDLQSVPERNGSVQEYNWSDEGFIRRTSRELHHDLLAIESLSNQKIKIKF